MLLTPKKISSYDQGVMSGIIVMPYWTSYFNNPDDVMTGSNSKV
jgi:hypothetical protein